ncbi:MAG: helix-turn-helix domain-containing protein [Chloroflexi bacterium]|nr:helix-turn-helix domain-containing protein [Chloroflexota bacterium]
MSEFLSVKQVAQLLRRSETTVRRYIRSGKLEAVRVGRHVRVPREAVEALMLGEATDFREPARPLYRTANDLTARLDESPPVAVSSRGARTREEIIRDFEAMLVQIDRDSAEGKEYFRDDPVFRLAGVVDLDETLNLGERDDEFFADALWREYRDEHEEAFR